MYAERLVQKIQTIQGELAAWRSQQAPSGVALPPALREALTALNHEATLLLNAPEPLVQHYTNGSHSHAAMTSPTPAPPPLIGSESHVWIQHAVSQALLEAPDFYSAIPTIFAAIGEGLGWSFGDLWCVDETGAALKCTQHWSAQHIQAAGIQPIRVSRRLKAGEGLPGRVWASGAPAWVADIDTDPHFPRLETARQLGLCSALAFPILGRHTVFGVVQFLSASPRPPDDELFQMVTTLGHQMGQFIERRRAEKAASESLAALEEQRQRLQAIFDNTQDAIFLIDDRGTCLDANPAACHLLQHRRETLVGTVLWKIITPPGLTAQDPWHNVVTHNPQRGEYILQRWDGTALDVEYRAIPQIVPGVHLLVLRNVTEHKHLLQAVQRERRQAQANEEYYRFLAESIPQIVWTARPDGWVYYYNQRWYDFTGLSFTQSQGWGWQQGMHPDDVPHCITQWRQALATGSHYEVELRYKRGHDNAYCWHLVRAIPLRNQEGQIVKWLGTSTDIHGHKRAQETSRFLTEAGTLLASSLDYKQTLAELMPRLVPTLADWCVMAVASTETDIPWMTGAHRDPTQVPVLQSLVERYTPLTPRDIGLPKVMRTGELDFYPTITPQELGCAPRTPEPTLVAQLGLQSYICVPLIARGRILGALALVRTTPPNYTCDDLTLAEELARRAAMAIDNGQLYHEAQAAILGRDHFLSVASHELKTPITALQGYAELLQRRATRNDAMTPRDQRAVATIFQQAHRLRRLIDVLLDISRIQMGQLTVKLAPVNLIVLLQRLLESMQLLHDHHTLVLHCPAEEIMIQGDELRLEQMIQNLIDNAVKYSPRGGEVTVRLAQGADGLQLSICDQGIGIPAAAQPHLFDRFYRATNAENTTSGLGIGLYLVKEIATLHGGDITVQSQEGEGSTFTILFPLPTPQPES